MVHEYCRTSPNLSFAILRATRSRGEDGKMHNHQSRVPESIREEFAANILLCAPRIRSIAKGRSLGGASDRFDALHDLLDMSRPDKGIGPVTLYDVATRIGAYLAVEPTSLYLHAGVKEGIVALMTAEDRTMLFEPTARDRVAQDDLWAAWPAFCGLPPDEVEDLLCTYRHAFKECLS
jgi:hypothetical protein